MLNPKWLTIQKSFSHKITEVWLLDQDLDIYS